MLDEIEEEYSHAVGFKSAWFRRSIIKSFLKQISFEDIMDSIEVIAEKRRVGFPYTSKKSDLSDPIGLVCWKYFLGILKNKVKERSLNEKEKIT